MEGGDSLYNRYNGIPSVGTNPVKYAFDAITPESWGSAAYDGFNFAFALGAAKAHVPLKMGLADGLNRSQSLFGVTVLRINNNTSLPIRNKIAPSGTTQGVILFGIGSKGYTFFNEILFEGIEK